MESPFESGLPLPGDRVLVVDRDPSSRAAIAERLVGAGFRVLMLEAMPHELEAANYAVIHRGPGDHHLVDGTDDRRARLTISRLRAPAGGGHEADELATANKQLGRILAALAPLLVGADLQSGSRLAAGLDILRSTIWGRPPDGGTAS